VVTAAEAVQQPQPEIAPSSVPAAAPATVAAPAPDSQRSPSTGYSQPWARPASTSQVPVAAPAAPAPQESAKSGESFDELAFLSSVVGRMNGGVEGNRPNAPGIPRPTPAQSAARRTAEQSAVYREEARPVAPPERPRAPDVSANVPIVLRNAVVSEQVKTLKCTECGSMNYPTEWYCERCGAELAAL
jgi:hypothetical protein